MPYDAISMNQMTEFAESIDPLDVIRGFDVDADVPLRQGLAIGLLRMSAAVRTHPSVLQEAVVTVGSSWCEIVHADVEYRLDDGLRLVTQSEDAVNDLEQRHESLSVTDLDVAYVLARWHDGAGKIRYRTTAYSRAVRDFEKAVHLARLHDLWWTLPDLQSNYERARFEELRQGLTKKSDQYGTMLRELTAGLDAASSAAERTAATRGITLDDPHQVIERRRSSPTDIDALRALEFLRGFSSLLHNSSVAVHDDIDREPGERIAASLDTSRRAAAISIALGDEYRLPQALQQQALLAEAANDLHEARRLFDQVVDARWKRGSLIAKQRRALLPPDQEQRAAELKLLLEQDLDPVKGSITGSDLDIRAWTIRFYAGAARAALTTPRDTGRLPSTDEQAHADDLEREIQGYELRSVRAVRQVLALPMYKRGYAELVRPVYTNAATVELSSAQRQSEPKAIQQLRDNAFGYSEESSARELLDMLSARSLPRLGPPPSRVGEEVMADLRAAIRPRGSSERRRGTAAPVGRKADRRVADVMAERAEEFEAVLQRNPLEIAPHDAEIAHRVMMMAANDPRTAFVRYVVTGRGDPDDPQRLSAFVARGQELAFVPGPLRSDVIKLAEALPITRAPNRLEADRLWQLLVDEAWTAHLGRGGDLDHLVVVPTDEVFALPLHAACSRANGARPLGVEVAVTYSVSATAYVSRGRHLLRRMAVDTQDDLAVVVGADPDDSSVSGGEIAAAGWPAARTSILGAAPVGIPAGVDVREVSWARMREIEERKPEFFVYLGHGGYLSQHAELGPYLMLPGDVMTQFDVALRLRLPRNKLTVLGACVAAQGMAAGGGEVAGFVRSLMAAGAGAIALPLWSATDASLVHTVGSLLRASRNAAEGTGLFDVVDALRMINEAAWTRASASKRFEALPLALYL